MFDLSTRILIVDDMVTMRKLVTKVCRELGFSDIVEAVDGKNAWETLEIMPSIGLVISDWNMPNVSGLDLLKKVRGDVRFMKLPFIMVTAEAEQHQIVDAIRCSVSNYVVKPFTTATLREKLEEVHRRMTGKAAA